MKIYESLRDILIELELDHLENFHIELNHKLLSIPMNTKQNIRWIFPFSSRHELVRVFVRRQRCRDFDPIVNEPFANNSEEFVYFRP